MVDATQLLSDYATGLSKRLAGVTTEGAEAQLADLVPNLLRAFAAEQGRSGIDLRGQAHEKGFGIPDFSVKDGLLLIGHVECKAPGVGASPSKFKTKHDKEQWKRFRNLPNLLYTDGVEWGLYRSGERLGGLLRLSLPAPGEAPGPDLAKQAAKLSALAAQLFSWKAVAPPSLRTLAEALAPLTAVLRDEIRAQLEDEDSQVFKASDEFRAALFPERDPDQVADAFAQVCAYSMLLARSRGARDLTAHDIEISLEHGHPVLARVVRVLLDNETEEEIGWALDTVRSLIEVVDFETLRGGKALPGMTHHDQTWLYFYEEFLTRYDPKLRDEYGVYYTPQGVISAQVRLLDEILRTRLNKPQGLGSPGITLLDPSSGTGSYPLRVGEVAADSALQAFGEAAVAGVVSSLARNLFAFEVLVGPYAVAHLRLSEIIADYQAEQPPDGVQVYLTDTLSSPFAEPTSLTRLLEPLVDEQKRALEVKHNRNILVCIGNPPYQRGAGADAQGEGAGGWVVHGDPQVEAPPIFDAFLKPANERTMFSHVASLYNEYVYFWRWALWKVFESPNLDGTGTDGPGVVSFISAASYLHGPGFLGMREHMRRLCDEIWVIDLGGEGRGARREENVFVIQRPVAICIAVRSGSTRSEQPATVRYTRIRGDRGEKLEALGEVASLGQLEWFEASSGWDDPFTPRSSEAWEQWPLVTDLFPWQSPGVKVGRTWPIAPLAETLEQRWSRLAGSSSPEDRARCFVNPRHGRRTTTVVDADTLPPPVSKGTIDDLAPGDPVPPAAPYGFRPFDSQWLLADPRVIALQRPGLWWAHSERQIYMVGFFVGILGRGPAAIASAFIPDLHAFRGSFGGKDVIPLYRSSDHQPNVTGGLVAKLGERLDVEVTVEGLFAYCYALLSSPAYVERFWDELEKPGPRLPITTDPQLFEQVRELGERVLDVHTHGKDGKGPSAPGKAKLVEAIGELPPSDSVSYDAASRTLSLGEGRIAPVAPAVWEFEVSGWEVLERWIKWRLRDPVGAAKSSTSPLDRIRPTSWSHEFTVELLELIWTLERTIELHPEQAQLLEAVCASNTARAADLPEPTAVERAHPKPPKKRKPKGKVHPQQTGFDTEAG